MDRLLRPVNLIATGLSLLAISAIATPAETPQWHTVRYVYDGDTVLLDNGEKVRLLALNTPEVAHKEKAGQAGGDEARSALSHWIAGRRVRLELEAEQRDRYGRLLAHLFDDEGNNLNARLLREGFAHVSIHPPNTERTREYLALERVARGEERGIWRLPQYQRAPAATAWQWPNSFRRLYGRVTTVEQSRRYLVLHVAEQLTVRVALDQLDTFAAAGIDLRALAGQVITVRGWVHRRDQQPPHMKLYHPLQLEE